MGVDIDSRLVVGLPYSKIVECFEVPEDENIVDFLYELGISYCSPYYDAPCEDCIFGVEVGAYGDFTLDVIKQLRSAQDTFFTLAHKEGKVYCSPHIT